jgi:hypothetical protein
MNNYIKYKILQLCDSSIHVGDILFHKRDMISYQYKIVKIENNILYADIRDPFSKSGKFDMYLCQLLCMSANFYKQTAD